MRKTWKFALLIAISSTFLLTGCRRQPVETESETQSETLTEKVTEKQTEKVTEKATEKQTEKQTKKQTEAASASKKTDQSTQKTSVAPSETNSTEQSVSSDSSSTQICPYCYQSFSTVQNADGTSEYSTHYAQEKAYADMYGIQPSGDVSDDTAASDNSNTSDSGDDSNTASDSSSGSDDNSYSNSDSTSGYASDQCPYCGQWFSTAPDESGYSPYGEHLAAESAYAAASAAQQGQQYQECPYCGQWLDPITYQDHVTNLY